MANFHSNYLVITANEQDICKVLTRMAENLAANSEYTNFSIDCINGIDTARELYYQVGPFIQSSYIWVFAGAPIRDDIAAQNTAGWTSPTSSENGFMQQVAALSMAMNSLNANLPEGTSVSLSMTAPTGRAMSDSASVGFARYGVNWALSIDYDTAWSPNAEDLDVFFMGLPEGDYGVSFYDADEYDGYESISTYNGLHHGLAPMHVGGSTGMTNKTDFLDRKRQHAGWEKSQIADLAELADAVVVAGWQVLDWEDEDEEYEDDYSYGGYGYNQSDGELVNLWDRPPVNWRNLSANDINKIVRAIPSVMSALPLVRNVGYGWTKEGCEAAEALLPGDYVVARGEWSASDFSATNVSTTSGVKLGIMSGWIDLGDVDYEITRLAPAILALLLPHMCVTVESLVPVSLRSKGVEGPKMKVRLEMKETDLTTLSDEVRAVLAKSCAERSLTSSAKEAM